MDFVLKAILLFLLIFMAIRIITNIIAQHGIDFVGIFQDLWEKLRRQK